LFIGPVSWHRVLFRRQEKREVVFAANWMAIAGLACLSISIVGVVMLITDFLFSGTATAIAGGCLAAVIVVLWYVLPVLRLLRLRRRELE
jgi:hypothetical protein